MGEKCIHEEMIFAVNFKWISVLKVVGRENLKADFERFFSVSRNVKNLFRFQKIIENILR